MTENNAPYETAEGVLHRLQRKMIERAEARPLATPFPVEDKAGSSRHLLHGLEEAWGASATQEGRWLSELLQGSAAWEIIERPQPGKKRHHAPALPRFREMSRCETLLRIMRESGELAEREHRLKERDNALRAIMQDATLPEIGRQWAAREVYAHFFADVARLTQAYRPVYQEMRRALGTIPSLTGPRVRSHVFLQPPLMTRLFAACHADKTDFFTPLPPGNDTVPFVASGEYRSGRHAVTIRVAPGAPDLLDEMTWDIAAIAVCAFSVRTVGNDPEARFPFLIDDYFDWRGVDPRKRTMEVRQQIDLRIRLLCSPERLFFGAESELWLPVTENNGAGRRRRTAVTTGGAFLTRRSGLFRPSPWVTEAKSEPLYGYLISLGSWARPFLEGGAMMGVFPKKIAEYDLRRQQWERRIGWYLTFQMQNQGTKMAFREEEVTTAASGKKTVLQITPQHSLKMKTVLQNSHTHWEEMARTNPGKVVRQWVDTLETLRRDSILGDYSCLDGAADGADLPTRSRLGIMLNYRYLFTPGGDLAKHLRRKSARRAAE